MTDLSFLEKLNTYWYKPLHKLTANIQLASSQKEKWQTLIPLFEQISAQNAVFIMIYNAVLRRFMYVVDKRNIIGYDAALFLAENGYEFSLANIHPDYLQSLLLSQEEALKFLIAETGKQKHEMIISLESVYKKSNGEYFQFLQQSLCLETDSNNNPVLLLSYVHDITYLKKNGTVNLVIKAPDDLKWWNFNFDKQVLEPIQPLTKQEKKVLLLLAEGKSSKEIAGALNISSHTIDTHRRRLLEKTNCIDTTGMITYCKLVGLI